VEPYSIADEEAERVRNLLVELENWFEKVELDQV